MSDKLREALEAVLSAGRGPSGRIILERYQEDKLREALAADDAARGTLREAWDAVIAEARGIDAIDLLDKVAAYGEACWQAATRAAAPKTSELETFLSLAKAAGITHIGQLEPGLTEALRKTEIAAPQSAGPVWIQPDHLQKARRAPFLCRVEPAKRDDFVPLYPSPPAAPTDAQWVEEARRLSDALNMHIKTLRAALRNDGMVEDMERAAVLLSTRTTAPQSTCNGMPAYEGLLSAAQSAAPRNVKPVAWLAYDGAHQLFIVGGDGPHDLHGGFPVYLRPQQAEVWMPIETAPKDGTRVILAKHGGPVWSDCAWKKMTRVPDRWESFVGPVRFDPTHWRPLPAPPATQQAVPTEADRLDAERYRWLRKREQQVAGPCAYAPWDGPPMFEAELDAAIDDAMSAQAGGKEQGA